MLPDTNLAHGDAGVVIDVVGEHAGLMEVNFVGDQEVEDVVGSWNKKNQLLKSIVIVSCCNGS